LPLKPHVRAPVRACVADESAPSARRSSVSPRRFAASDALLTRMARTHKELPHMWGKSLRRHRSDLTPARDDESNQHLNFVSGHPPAVRPQAPAWHLGEAHPLQGPFRWCSINTLTGEKPM